MKNKKIPFEQSKKQKKHSWMAGFYIPPRTDTSINDHREHVTDGIEKNRKHRSTGTKVRYNKTMVAEFTEVDNVPETNQSNS
jgi:hypothetical protein